MASRYGYDDEAFIFLIGDGGVGKSSIVDSWPGETVEDIFYPTAKVVEVGGKRVKLLTWEWKVPDVDAFYGVLFPEVTILVYDITNKKSFESIRNSSLAGFLQDDAAKRYTHIFLLGNKCDKSAMREVSRKEGEDLADYIGATFMETSVTKSFNILETLELMVKEIPKYETRDCRQLRHKAVERSRQYRVKRQEEAESCGMSPALLNMVKSSTANFSNILIHGVEENYFIRVMIVGNGGVGKTTLTRRLLELPVHIKNYDSTDGIDVHIHSCEVDLKTEIWSLKEKKYGLFRRLKNKLPGIKQKTETRTTSTAGARDVHLRFAMALQNDPNLKEGYQKTIIEEDHLLSDEFDASDQASGDTSENSTETDSEVRRNMKTKHVESDHSPEHIQTTYEASSEPLPRSSNAIDIEETLQKAKYLTADQHSRKAIISFYDFAGQDVFHASHPTFLSSGAIYILTFDLQRMLQSTSTSNITNVVTDRSFGDCNGAIELSDLESIIFWLHTIYMFAAASKGDIHPQVVLVGTHVDKLPKSNREAVIARFFREFRKAIAKSPLNAILTETEYSVDNTKKNNQVFSQLKTEIFKLAKLQPNWGEKSPTKWLPLDREMQLLKESGHKVLTLKELKEINNSMDVKLSNGSEMDLFLQFLHATGEVVFFNEKSLRDNIVLDPVWLMDSFKTIITAEDFALRNTRLAASWTDFSNSGIISHSTIVAIFEESLENPSLFKNHDHVIRLMEKFLFVASPVGLTDELEENSNKEKETDVSYIVPCMVHKKADQELITSLEGSSSTSVFCMVSINHFLPPAIFQKLMAMCITKWPIVEQGGQKLLFYGICRFNIDKQGNYKLTVFLVKYAIHARIVSYVDKEQTYFAVCQPVQEFLVQSLRSILKAMGLADEFRSCIQCPQFSAADSGGYIDIDHMEKQDTITCDECPKSHAIKTLDHLGSWMEMSSGSNLIKGLKGEQGIKGARGEPGPVGTIKPPGPPPMVPDSSVLESTTGEKGHCGEKGESGTMGLPGIDGKVGELGLPGSLGPIGIPGPEVPKGDMGDADPQGPPGIAISCPPGSTGKPGISALPPPIAEPDKGAMGPPGIPGLPGLDGKDGLPGLLGPAGPKGLEELDNDCMVDEECLDDPITHDHINHYRIRNMIETIGGDCLREIILIHAPVGYGSIYNALVAKRAALAAMKQLRQEQINQIFPYPNQRFTATVDQFDITLLYALIRNVSTVPAPLTGWGKNPQDQPRDASLGANIERIRLYRNRVIGHSVDSRLNDQQYEDFCDEISQIIDDVELLIGIKGFQADFVKYKNQIITPQEAKSLRNKFQNYQNQLQEYVDSLARGMKKAAEGMKEADEGMKKLKEKINTQF